ncbi:MAG: nucleoside triphosphate pyrophosphohydrolase family protein [Ktedonobacteraceae bacterium]|nr:nucleoside triphosphate pyrophosphohydrolase family protein [Ktedonobacteraceae bacterium]
MDGKEYREEVLRTYAGSDDPQEKLTLAALGLTGESGEVADHMKKALFQGHAIDMAHLRKELSDILWYIVLACDATGCSLEDVMQINVDKLRKRYPNGFDAERSVHRNRYE